MPNRILKECAEPIAPILQIILQQSLDMGDLPKDWRDANISNIFKKGDKHLPENYRPVSLTSVTSKILEHIICRHMLKHLEKNKILTNLNHGFRSGYSCEAQLLTTINDFLQEHDKGHQIDVAILDFSKAFDKVPHNRLLLKLDHYGIRGNTLQWIRHFLTDCTQQVLLEGTHSSTWFRRTPRNSAGTLTFSCIHQRSTGISYIQRSTICRWLPTVSCSQHQRRAVAVPRRPTPTSEMGKNLANVIQYR